MPTILFRTIDAGRTGVVQFHFVAPRDRTRYEEDIKPIHDSIVESVPDRNRHYDQATLSWQIPRSHWPKIQKLLFDHGLQLRKETHKRNAFREATRDIAQILCVACLWIAAAVFWNVLAHLLHSKAATIPVRLFMTLMLCLVCFISLRFGDYIQGFISICLAFVFRPIDPIWFKSWWIWQLLNWGTLLVLIAFTVRCAVAARKEEKLDHWWYSLSEFEPYVDDE